LGEPKVCLEQRVTLVLFREERIGLVRITNGVCIYIHGNQNTPLFTLPTLQSKEYLFMRRIFLSKEDYSRFTKREEFWWFGIYNNSVTLFTLPRRVSFWWTSNWVWTFWTGQILVVQNSFKAKWDMSNKTLVLNSFEPKLLLFKTGKNQFWTGWF
jgi:hypothetical protein